MANAKLGISFLAICLLSLAACGDGNFVVPHNNFGPSPDFDTEASTDALQLVLKGSHTPLQSLDGVHVGETVEFELIGAEPGAAVSWFTTDVTRANFIKAGLLQLRGTGRFEVH